MSNGAREIEARLRRIPVEPLSPDERDLVKRIEMAGYTMVPGLSVRVHRALTRRRLERCIGAAARNGGSR